MNDFSQGLGGFGQTTYNSGAADGNQGGGGAGGPNMGHSAVFVALVVIIAIVLLITGVIGLRASGEVVI